MARDLRDPKLLGQRLLWWSGMYAPHKASLVHPALFKDVPDYRDETTIEKYGDPRKLPSTLPN